MNKALKLSELNTDLSDLSSGANQTTEKFSSLDANEIRAKIKAARLEKLMARQLESELSIELDEDISVETTPKPSIQAETAASTTIALSTDQQVNMQELPASKARGYSAGSSKRMRNIQATKHSCDEMVSRIRSSAEVIAELNEQSTNMVKQLHFMEQEFAAFEEAEFKAAKLGTDYKRVTAEYEEALNLIEKQNRQLNVLETQRANSNANYENTKNELEKLQRQYQREVDLFSESQMLNTELEQDNKSLKNKLAASEQSTAELELELQTTSNALKQKDMEAAKAKAELISAKERLGNAEASIESGSRELEQMSRDFTNKEIEYQNLEAKHSGTVDALKAAEDAFSRSTTEIQNLTAELHEKDMTCAKLTSDYATLIKSNSKVMTNLDNVQKKYDELNKHALEQQSQQYARIHELESVLRDTKRKMELKTVEAAELGVELEATNNLLVLHEEMVAALSPEDRTK